MSAFGAVIVCILSGLGLASLIWAVAGAFMLPVTGDEDIRIHMVVEARGQCTRLQSVVSSAEWLLGMGIVEFDTVILDNGLQPEAVARARILAKRQNVTLGSMVTIPVERE